ncbi:Dipeptidyl-peptidase I [Giardia muris]|uniref:Dipeptidyl peptidase 1 n=1 Tax=Giardia muris TaxID=5742 RepID=A0A4Z1SUG5_GIAMU|nr:Dipeptidyl-peptidase I [Giardia muris]|eukprot:TNJ29350.1 Dipeptidyl-peptidase I [Giardia muris]
MLFPLLLSCALADFPVRCLPDQVLGTWEINVTDFDRPVINDGVVCPSTLKSTATRRRITLQSPNVAIDEDDGAVGTWSMVYTQAIRLELGDTRFLFYLDWEVLPDTEVLSHCARSSPKNSWAMKLGVTHRYRACIQARNVHPISDKTDSIHDPSNPGPIHRQGTDRIFIPHYLPVPVPVGKTYRRLQTEGKLKYNSFKARAGAGTSDSLPASFDWRNVDNESFLPEEVADQGSCGSCYAASTLWTMMSRVMVASGRKDLLGNVKKLSLEHVVDCNAYTQGCDGGFPELVAQFAEEYGILTDDQYYSPYVAGTGMPATCMAPEFLQGERYYFTAGRPIGGYFDGLTPVEEMQLEVLRHGPIVVNVYGSSQAFRDCQSTYTSDDGEGGEGGDYLDYLDHAVMIIGWEYDETQGETYWLVQNSWGKDWCEDGVTKIKMGSNEFGIESYPVTFYWWSTGPVYYDEGLFTIDATAFYTCVGIIVALLLLVIGLIIGMIFVVKKTAKTMKIGLYRPILAEETTAFDLTSAPLDTDLISTQQETSASY